MSIAALVRRRHHHTALTRLLLEGLSVVVDIFVIILVEAIGAMVSAIGKKCDASFSNFNLMDRDMYGWRTDRTER
jgi:hypothetical protein